MFLELYIDNCKGCDHWREYELVSITKEGHLVFRCSTCKLTVTLTRTDLEEMVEKGFC